MKHFFNYIRKSILEYSTIRYEDKIIEKYNSFPYLNKMGIKVGSRCWFSHIDIPSRWQGKVIDYNIKHKSAIIRTLILNPILPSVDKDSFITLEKNLENDELDHLILSPDMFTPIQMMTNNITTTRYIQKDFIVTHIETEDLSGLSGCSIENEWNLGPNTDDDWNEYYTIMKKRRKEIERL